ncbi:hypothetical protein EYC08_09215 [Tabrizicola sp. WMC-M-20]|nr:hypothetical protein EYC08_09215 [Tabrizicola sp. WMC-M-20]
MIRCAALIVMLAIPIAPPLAAHEAGIGPNGGMRVDATPYRVELVPDGSVVTIHLTLDATDEVVDTTAMTGLAILLVDGKPLRLPLTPAVPGTLSADAAVPLPAEVKGAVQITDADGKTVQAKF